ncbi:thioredoxin [Chengkuizengella axinellae]|uniref:Thioredoxin n=1 Tax=Chengkuizengella axinellae TaxID=3064388 RepID=A0ABT9IX83_9BACL|nr:thioredoxin [Chengkuizengella sp. 2205SS18-9]MDP5273933.1 thioredoxin [Chengkuizengella sp. 2205SS18-9]
MTMKSIAETDFKSNIKTEGITLVDFSTPWCPPCKVLNPILEELSEEMNDTVNTLEINIDESPSVSAEYGVMSMPTVIIFKDGEPVEKLVGLRPKSVYTNIINKYS